MDGCRPQLEAQVVHVLTFELVGGMLWVIFASSSIGMTLLNVWIRKYLVIDYR